MPSNEIGKLQEDRERLRAQHAAGVSGLLTARGLSDAMDEAVSGIWGRTAGTDGAALVALGGYGRRELFPYSDIDLLVLHKKPARVADASKRMSYELWDSGLELAQVVNSPKDLTKLASARFDVETSLIDARLVAGDATLFEELRNVFLRKLGPSSPGFTQRLAESVPSWRRNGGDAGVDLEPNIKEGKGGLRDLIALGWISAERSDRVKKACGHTLDILYKARHELHYSTGRRTDTLQMQLQTDVARTTSPSPPPSLEDLPAPSEEVELLRNIYFAARQISSGLDEMLFSDEEADSAVQAFSSSTAGFEGVWTGEMLRAFFDLLVRPGVLGRAFWNLVPDLIRVLPEWRNIHCLPQRNIYHRYAVDVHSLAVAQEAGRLSASDDELTKRVAEESRGQIHTLVLAALLHDIGKGTSENHSERGEKLARSAVDRMGLESEMSDDVVWLVANHLLLAETATRRDIGDEGQIVSIAERVGNERRLRLLYLLTVADAIATGPSAWGPWKATLIARLFIRVGHLIDSGELVGASATEIAREMGEKLKAAISERPMDQVDHHLANMPRAWLLSQPEEALLHQTRLMMEPLTADAIVIDPVPQSETGIWEVTVVARDRPGLFSKVSGVLALHGLNVLGAQIFTREDGVALEVFRVEALGDEKRRFERVGEDARKALRGRLSLDVRLAQKRKDYALRIPKGKQEPTNVVVDNRASDFYTIIEVHASDRVGLLYTITRALSDMELDIHLAKVSTYGEDVVDVFYVRDLEGQKVEDPDHTDEIRKTILHRLEMES